MALPLSTVISVNITKETVFPTAKGFGTILLLTGEPDKLATVEGLATYSSINEVAVDWDSTSEAYKMAATVFSQNPSVIRIKIGWYEDTVKLPVSRLDEIVDVDNDWYGLACWNTLRDDAEVTNIAEWVEPRVKRFITTTNDILTKDAADATCIAAQIQLQGYNRTYAFYHDVATEYPCCASLGVMLTVDFYTPDSAKTWKFKKLNGIPPVALTSAELEAITGFVPAVGFDPANGKFCNTYISVGGVSFVAEGTGGDREFFDTCHFVDWLQDAVAVRILGTLTTAPKIHYTDVGAQRLIDDLIATLEIGIAAGGIASAIDDDGNQYPEYQVQVQKVKDVPPAQRANRIAPTLRFTARLAGAIHYVSVVGTVTV